MQAEGTICDMLMRDLRKALTIVCPRAYPDYRAFVQVRGLSSISYYEYVPLRESCVHFWNVAQCTL